jgi:hypothetical protein
MLHMLQSTDQNSNIRSIGYNLRTKRSNMCSICDNLRTKTVTYAPYVTTYGRDSRANEWETAANGWETNANEWEITTCGWGKRANGPKNAANGCDTHANEWENASCGWDTQKPLLSKAENRNLFCGQELTSLLEIMKQFRAWGFLSVIEDLEIGQQITTKVIKERGGDSEPSDEWKKELLKFLNQLYEISEASGFEKTTDKIIQFKNFLYGQIRSGQSYICKFNVIDSELHGLKTAVYLDLADMKFTSISKEKGRYFEQEKLFGNDVFEAFEEARREIKDAGNCIAQDLNTAAVFHLMRVMELGLRELAARLKANALIKKLKQTKIPIELGTWEEIIVTLESKLDGMRNKPRSIKRDNQIDTCNELLKEFRSVKDLWRNKVMHTRATYDAKQAESAFDHVCLFMQKLAKFH